MIAKLRDTRFSVHPKPGYCGPTALRNALAFMGIEVPIARLALWAETDTDGTDEFQLRYAAGHVNVTMGAAKYWTVELAKASLVDYLKRGPVLLCVDRGAGGNWNHWVAALHATKRHVWIADGERPGPALQRLTWRQLLQRWPAIIPSADKVWARFDVYPLTKAA